MAMELDSARSFGESTTSTSHCQGFYQARSALHLGGRPCRAARLMASTRAGRRHQLRRLAMVEAQHPTEAFSPSHQRVVVGGCARRRDQPVVEPLVIALPVVVLDKLCDGERRLHSMVSRPGESSRTIS
jgi:hypothetical protein